MAVFSTLKTKKQTKGAMAGVLNYISDSNKVYYNNIPFRIGINCNYYSGFAEMCVTKQQHKKDDGRQFYQFVQSFAEEDNVTPLEGWLGEMQDYYKLTKDVISLSKNLESVGNSSPPLTPKTWTDRN